MFASIEVEKAAHGIELAEVEGALSNRQNGSFALARRCNRPSNRSNAPRPPLPQHAPASRPRSLAAISRSFDRICSCLAGLSVRSAKHQSRTVVLNCSRPAYRQPYLTACQFQIDLSISSELLATDNTDNTDRAAANVFLKIRLRLSASIRDIRGSTLQVCEQRQWVPMGTNEVYPTLPFGKVCQPALLDTLQSVVLFARIQSLLDIDAGYEHGRDRKCQRSAIVDVNRLATRLKILPNRFTTSNHNSPDNPIRSMIGAKSAGMRPFLLSRRICLPVQSLRCKNDRVGSMFTILYGLFRSMAETCGGDGDCPFDGSVNFAACSAQSGTDDRRLWLKTHNNLIANPESQACP